MFRLLIVILILVGSRAPAAAAYVALEPSNEMVSSAFVASGVASALLTTTAVYTLKDEKVFAAYLRQNAVHLRSDISLGAGDTIDELASLYGIPTTRVAAFGRTLRARRRSLLLAMSIEDELLAARVFRRIVRVAIAESPG